MKRLQLSALVLAGMTLSGQSLAEDYSANVSMVSNYVYRGISYSEDAAAVQGGMDYAKDGFYIGAWGSSDAYNGEIDFYAGYGFALNDNINIEVGALRYYFPTVGPNFTEYHVTLDTPLAAFSYHYDVTNDNTYMEINRGFSITDELSLDFHYGSWDVDADSTTYWDYSVGASYQLSPKYSLGLTYTDHEMDTEYAEGTFIFALNASF